MNLRRIVRNAASLTLMRAVSSLCSFALLVYLTRHWPAPILGAFSTLNALSLVMLPLPLLGVHTALIRDVVAAPDRASELGSSALLFALAVASLAALAIGVFVMQSYPRALWASGWLIGVAALPTAYTQVNDCLLVARERLALWARIAVIEVICRTAVWALLVWNDQGVTACFVAFLVLRVCAAGSYRVLSPDSRLLVLSRATAASVRQYVRQVPDFAGILVATTLIARLDFLMLSRLSSLSAVAAYSAPYRVFEAIQTIPTIVAVALFPSLARAAATDDARQTLSVIAARCMWVIALAGIPGALLLGRFAEPITTLLFGARFTGSATVLTWLAAVPVVWAADQILSSILQSTRNQRTDVTVWLLSLVTYAVLLAVLIPRFDIRGAAIATCVAMIVQCAARLAAARHVVAVPTLIARLPAPVAAGAVMAVTLWALRNVTPMLAGAAGLIVYVLAVIGLGAVRRTDLLELRAAFSRREVTA